jgi:hypothetical protein
VDRRSELYVSPVPALVKSSFVFDDTGKKILRRISLKIFGASSYLLKNVLKCRVARPCRSSSG